MAPAHKFSYADAAGNGTSHIADSLFRHGRGALAFGRLSKVNCCEMDFAAAPPVSPRGDEFYSPGRAAGMKRSFGVKVVLLSQSPRVLAAGNTKRIILVTSIVSLDHGHLTKIQGAHESRVKDGPDSGISAPGMPEFSAAIVRRSDNFKKLVPAKKSR